MPGGGLSVQGLGPTLRAEAFGCMVQGLWVFGFRGAKFR